MRTDISQDKKEHKQTEPKAEKNTNCNSHLLAPVKEKRAKQTHAHKPKSKSSSAVKTAHTNVRQRIFYNAKFAETLLLTAEWHKISINWPLN